MSKCIAGLAFAVLNLLATAHAVPVLTYVEKTFNFNGSASAATVYSNVVPGDGGHADLFGTFSLDNRFHPPGTKMTVRSAELVALSRDDSSDAYQFIYQERSLDTKFRKRGLAICDA